MKIYTTWQSNLNLSWIPCQRFRYKKKLLNGAKFFSISILSDNPRFSGFLEPFRRCCFCFRAALCALPNICIWTQLAAFCVYCLLLAGKIERVLVCIFFGFSLSLSPPLLSCQKIFSRATGCWQSGNGHWSLGSGQCSGASEEDRWYSQNTRNANRNSNRLPNALNPHVKCYFPNNRTTEAAKRTRAHDSIVLGH